MIQSNDEGRKRGIDTNQITLQINITLTVITAQHAMKVHIRQQDIWPAHGVRKLKWRLIWKIKDDSFTLNGLEGILRRGKQHLNILWRRYQGTCQKINVNRVAEVQGKEDSSIDKNVTWKFMQCQIKKMHRKTRTSDLIKFTLQKESSV